MDGFLKTAGEKVLIFDGGMGSLILKAGLTPPDYGGYEGCNEYLSISKPGLIARIHADYFSAGAEVVETNTFGAAEHVLEEYGLARRTREINKAAALIAKKEAVRFSAAGAPKFVAGSIGPGSKLPSLGQITFDKLKASYIPQAEGLLDGGVDCFIVETSQDILQIKAALSAIIEVTSGRHEPRPIIAQVTIDSNGKTLTGSDISSVLAVLEPWPVAAIGLNCSLGPDGMASAVRYLSKNSSKLLSVMPNAGLPEIQDGKTVYTLSPADFAEQMRKQAENIGVNIMGGCCGTTPEHISLLAKALRNIKPRKTLKQRRPMLSSLYQVQEINVLPRPFIIGERANSNGSRQFKELLQKDDFEGMAEMAVSQDKESHALDLSVALAGRDEKKDMEKFVRLLNTRTQLPLMIDSTDVGVIELALKNISGRPVINSMNLEDGGGKAKKIVDLCRRYGAAVVVLAIDEQGMAMTAERKIEVVERLIGLAKDGGLQEQDIFVDALTFTLGSGDKGSKNAGIETLNAIKEIKKRWPACHAVLGVSNISYGLPLNARKFLNSVFLKRAIEYGLDAAILHAGKIAPLDLIPPETLRLCDNLIFPPKRNPPISGVAGRKDTLEAFVEYFAKYKHADEISRIGKIVSNEEKLRLSILHGSSDGLRGMLKKELKKHPALDIIQKLLLPTMDEVGDLFRQGKKQLPFVLRSAEVMRMAMDILKPFFGEEKKNKGSFVLATVRGDVHDIGKNLVDIIFSANGFEVINLGVRQPAESIVSAAKEYQPSAIGLSGLLVESAKAMKEYLNVFDSAGISVPVLCGGAALSANYVQKEMTPIYRGSVYYAADALSGLRIMEKLSLAEAQKQPSPQGREAGPAKTINPKLKEKPIKILFTKRNVIKKIPLAELFALIDRKALFMRRWHLPSMSAEMELNRLWVQALRGKLWRPQAVYAFFKANIKGGQVFLRDIASNKELLRLEFSKKIGGKFLDGIQGDQLIALQIVTVGPEIKKAASRLGKAKMIEKQFLLHGLAAETCEALAKWCNREIEKRQGWRKTMRLSPGYPIWPKLAEQKKIFALLCPQKIGIKLTETFQMEPEYSTSAVVLRIK